MGAFKVTTSYGLAATAIYSVVNAMKSGAQAIVDYDQGLKNLQAITGATQTCNGVLNMVNTDLRFYLAVLRANPSVLNRLKE